MRKRKSCSIWSGVMCLFVCLACVGATNATCNVTNVQGPIICEEGATLLDVFQAYSMKGNVSHIVANNMSITSFETGICIFNQTLRLLDLRRNNIQNLPNLSCLTKLEELWLSGNQLEYFDFTAIQGLSKLMKLDVTKNRIRNITHDGSLAVLESLVGLKSVNLSYNMLTNGDVFWFKIKNIEEIDLSHNNISKITNNLSIDFAKTSFNGSSFYVNLNFNEIETLTLSDMRDFGFDIEKSETARIWLRYCFELQENPWSCDCPMAHTLQHLRKSSNTLAAFKANLCLNKLTEATCKKPAVLRDKKLFHISPRELSNRCNTNCNMTSESDEKCICTKRQENDTTIDVDCSYRNFTNMPNFKLGYATLNVNLSHANIKTLEWKSFMNSTKNLTLAHSLVTNVDENFWSNLSKSAMESLNLRDTAIKTLRQGSLEKYDYPLIRIDLGGRYKCECDFVRWFEQWINTDKVSSSLVNKQNIVCEDGTRIDTWSSNSVVWVCEIPIIASLTSLFLLLATVVLTSYLFREELHVLMYRYVGLCCHPRANKYAVNNVEQDAHLKVREHKYDVYIYCADNDIRWTKDNVLDYLEGRMIDACPYMYTVGFQERDFMPGIPDADNMTNAVQRSRRFLFVLSQNMLRSVTCRKMFELANHVALKEGKGYIVIVQRENLSREQAAREPVLNAYLSRKYCLSPGDRLFYEKLCFRLPPKLKQQREDREIEIVM